MKSNKELQEAIGKVADQMPYGHIQAEADPVGFLEDVASRLAELKWRKVEDEPPPKDVDILVKDERLEPCETWVSWWADFREEKGWLYFDGWYRAGKLSKTIPFTHWMPIPGGEQ